MAASRISGRRASRPPAGGSTRAGTPRRGKERRWWPAASGAHREGAANRGSRPDVGGSSWGIRDREKRGTHVTQGSPLSDPACRLSHKALQEREKSGAGAKRPHINTNSGDATAPSVGYGERTVDSFAWHQQLVEGAPLIRMPICGLRLAKESWGST